MTTTQQQPMQMLVAPNTPESEEAVLGCILIEPRMLLEVREFLEAKHFFIMRNRWIYEVFEVILARSTAEYPEQDIDYLTVGNELNDRGILQDVGGQAYLTYLQNQVPNHTRAVIYARLVVDAYDRRELISAAQDIGELALTNLEAQDREQRVYDRMRLVFQTRDDEMRSAADVADELYDDLSNLIENPKSRKVIATGFNDLDYTTDGIEPGTMTVIAADTGHGKTAFMLSWIRNMMRSGVGGHVVLYSLEMSEKQNMRRLLSMEANVPGKLIKTGKLNAAEFARVTDAYERIRQWPLTIFAGGDVSSVQIAAQIEKLSYEVPLGAVFIDYLQLMLDGDSRDKTSRVVVVDAISRGLKHLALASKVPVITATQLNRNWVSRGDKRPQLSDIRESGGIAQNADNVWALFRPEMYDENTERVGEADVIVLKSREGELGSVSLYYKRELTMFASMERKKVYLNLDNGGNGSSDNDD